MHFISAADIRRLLTFPVLVDALLKKRGLDVPLADAPAA